MAGPFGAPGCRTLLDSCSAMHACQPRLPQSAACCAAPPAQVLRDLIAKHTGQALPEPPPRPAIRKCAPPHVGPCTPVLPCAAAAACSAPLASPHSHSQPLNPAGCPPPTPQVRACGSQGQRAAAGRAAAAVQRGRHPLAAARHHGGVRAAVRGAPPGHVLRLSGGGRTHRHMGVRHTAGDRRQAPSPPPPRSLSPPPPAPPTPPAGASSCTAISCRRARWSVTARWTWAARPTTMPLCLWRASWRAASTARSPAPTSRCRRVPRVRGVWGPGGGGATVRSAPAASGGPPRAWRHAEPALSAPGPPPPAALPCRPHGQVRPPAARHSGGGR